jgi:site-specific DNA-methyltransferase (adenine-specific)
MAFTIHHGDCLDVMRGIPDGSVDAIITDPPYGMNYQSAWRTDSSARKPKIANDQRPFIWWLNDAYRCTREGGSLVCFCEWRHQEVFRTAIATAGFTLKSQVIWDREWHGMGDLKASFAPQHDVIWFAVKGSFSFPGKRPRSVVRCKRIAAEELVHPTEKPVDLMRQLVVAVTSPGGTVCDPFAGSCSTGAAAVLEGRKFIGVEREASYCEIATGRIAAAEQKAGRVPVG